MRTHYSPWSWGCSGLLCALIKFCPNKFSPPPRFSCRSLIITLLRLAYRADSAFRNNDIPVPSLWSAPPIRGDPATEESVRDLMLQSRMAACQQQNMFCCPKTFANHAIMTANHPAQTIYPIFLITDVYWKLLIYWFDILQAFYVE